MVMGIEETLELMAGWAMADDLARTGNTEGEQAEQE